MNLSKSAIRDIEVGKKTCCKCGNEKGINSFRLKTNGKGYTFYQNQCRDCYNAYHVALHAKRKDIEEYKAYKREARRKTYYKCVEYSRKKGRGYYCPEKVRERNQQYINNLSDSYVVATMSHRSRHITKHIWANPELIQAYREYMKFNRLLKSVNNG